MLKSNNCGELNKNDIGKKVTLAGWVDRRRDHGQLIFIDLRDRSGLVQVVFNPERSKFSHEIASQLRSEYVVQITGIVSARPAGTENLKMATGEVEILVDQAVILNTSKTPPFYINEDVDVNENLRLKYRYLDLRRTRMKNNIILRHEVIKFMREFLYERGFLELETPILMKSTPEGARDYLVPSRLYPGKFYALPQSPQQFKQLLMVAGMEKYFQIARCFRDEDSRKDRQPEFTQLDIEMSFVEEEDILSLLENLFSGIVEKLKPDMKFNKPFLRLSYTEAMEKYGSDKPDLRFGLPIGNLSDIAARTEFGVFKTVVAEGGKVKGMVAPGCCAYTRSQLDELNALVQSLGAAGLLTISLGSDSSGSLDNLTMEKVKSRAAKFLTADNVRQMAERLGAKMGDLLLIVAGKPDLVSGVLGDLRKEMGQRLNLIDPNELKFAFIMDFPLLKWNQEESRWEAMHNPFTQPREEDLHLLDSAPEKVRGRHYDFVCNGYEIAGGSIRIHNAELQRRIFRLFGHSDEKINRLFGQLLEAFEYGAPPHGGVAPGVDRFVMLLAGGETIRDVIVFPKNQSAYDMMFDAPDEVSQKQIDELHIMLAPDAKISQ